MNDSGSWNTMRAASSSDGIQVDDSVGRRVLIIEDSPDTAKTLAQVFGLLGYRARVACDGASGIEAARQFRPDFVICDIGLPDMDGYEVARALRQDPSFAHTVLIALTGYTHAQDRQRAAEAGFDHHVAKPASLQALLPMLQRG